MSEHPKAQSTVARNASRMGLATLCSRVLGLVREQVFANLFGATHAADAFNIAFRIPNLLRDLFAEGAMSAAFVPNFTKALLESRAVAFRLLLAVLSVLVITVTLLAVVGIAFSPELVRLYAGAFESVPGKYEMAVALTRMMFPFFPLVAMAAVVMGALNALGFFFLPAFAPTLFNVASILCGLILCPLLAKYSSVPPVYGMAVGVVLGGFLQFYVQWVQVRRSGLRLLPNWQAILHPFQVPGVKRVLWLLIPGTLGLAATQLNILINSVYATTAGPGAVSWLNYAFRLMQFPIGVFGVSIAAAALPQVARKLATADATGAGQEVHRALRLTAAINGPAAAGLMAVGLPIVQLLFEHGRFSHDDSISTGQAVLWYALGLPGYSVVKVIVPVFYALGTTRAPVISSFLMVILNAIFNHIGLSVLKLPFWCLAAATSFTATLNAIILILILGARLPGLLDRKLVGSFLMHFLLSTAVGGAAWAAVKMAGELEPFLSNLPVAGRHAVWLAQVSLAMGASGVVWLGIGKLFRVAEIEQAFGIFQKRLRRSK